MTNVRADGVTDVRAEGVGVPDGRGREVRLVVIGGAVRRTRRKMSGSDGVSCESMMKFFF